MEREGIEVTIRLLRAIRSLTYNKRLQPLVEQRIERAESTIRSHLSLQDTAVARIGPYKVEANDNGEIEITKRSIDGWQQLTLSIGDEKPNSPCESEPSDWTATEIGFKHADRL